MRNRLTRLCVVVVLLATAAAAAYVGRGWLQAPAVNGSADLDQRVERLLALTSELRGAEAAYVVPGQDPTSALEKFPALLHDTTTLAVETSTMLQSSTAAAELRGFADATSRLAEADAAAREQLLVGDALSAAHIIFGQGSQAAGTMTAALLRARTAERAQALAAVAETSRQTLRLMLGVSALWVVGLLVLAFVPAGRRDSGAAGDVSQAFPPASVIDLNAAADLCTDISRVETTAALTGLLTRAVTLLEAKGVVVWMESGGELHAAATAGYPPDATARLSAIRRHDDNVTATAWRDAAPGVLEGNDQKGGLIAVPLLNGRTCCGVFAIELRPGTRQDEMTGAVVRMIAAQLASVVVGPVASSVPPAVAAGS